MRIITVTVSDTRTEADDTSGKALREELAACDVSFVLERHAIVPDEPGHITALVREADEAGIDALVLTGGTGIARRDNTYETLIGLFDKKLDGFGEAFRRLSWEQIGARAILSRATAGVVGTTIVFSLPGSEKAVRLGVKELIAPILSHAVDLVKGRTKHGP